MALVNQKSDLRSQTLLYLKENSYENNPEVLKKSTLAGALAADTLRIFKYIASTDGLLFAGNQAALLAGRNLVQERRLDITNISAEVAGMIGSILAQVPVNGTGTHFNIFELAAAPGNNPYYYIGQSADKDTLYRGEVILNRDAVKRSTDKNFTTSSRFSINPATGQPEEDSKKYYLQQENYLQTGGTITVNLNKNRMRGSRALDSFDKATGYGFEAGTFQIDQISRIGRWTGGIETLEKELGPDWDPVPVLFSIGQGGVDIHQLPFRGFVQNITDRYSPSWNPTTYVGRGEPVYTMTSTTRTLGFDLTIPILSQEEQGPVYEKIDNLLSCTYPKYVNNLPQGAIVKLRIGDLLNNYGVITSIGYTVANNVPWSKGNLTLTLPQVITLTISMNVIHSKLPTRFTDDRDRSFIAPGTGSFLIPPLEGILGIPPPNTQVIVPEIQGRPQVQKTSDEDAGTFSEPVFFEEDFMTYYNNNYPAPPPSFFVEGPIIPPSKDYKVLYDQRVVRYSPLIEP